ncbi:hypothetical protein ACFO9Q_18055 [Paenibacillus sp. GCM10023252]|uniref:hypothetical protein n=1 Tax=Paenibacillus sp. GCM10023252 TaxID=3252649 RepID=UPI0036213969
MVTCELHTAFDDAYLALGAKPQRHGLSLRSAAEWYSLLHESGFSNIRWERSVHQEVYPSARDFLHAVKAMGASTSEAAAPRGLSSRCLFAEMYKQYEARFSVPQGVAASYDMLWIQGVNS